MESYLRADRKALTVRQSLSLNSINTNAEVRACASCQSLPGKFQGVGGMTEKATTTRGLVKCRPCFPPEAHLQWAKPCWVSSPAQPVSWPPRAQGQKAGSGSAGQGCPYLSEWEDDIAAAILLAGEADVTVRGKHPPHGVTAAEWCPQRAVHNSVQPLLPRQPEERPEELILCSGFQVPGRGGREKKKRQGR